MSNTLRRGASIGVLAALLITLLQFVSPGAAEAQPPSIGPSPCVAFGGVAPPLPCEADGEAFADSERTGTDDVDVRFGVRNGTQDAIVALSLNVPAELAASTQCRLTQGEARGAPFDPNNIVVGADGSLAIPSAGPYMAAGDELEFTCRTAQVENCGLVATTTSGRLTHSPAHVAVSIYDT